MSNWQMYRPHPADTPGYRLSGTVDGGEWLQLLGKGTYLQLAAAGKPQSCGKKQK